MGSAVRAWVPFSVSGCNIAGVRNLGARRRAMREARKFRKRSYAQARAECAAALMRACGAGAAVPFVATHILLDGEEEGEGEGEGAPPPAPPPLPGGGAAAAAVAAGHGRGAGASDDDDGAAEEGEEGAGAPAPPGGARGGGGGGGGRKKGGRAHRHKVERAEAAGARVHRSLRDPLADLQASLARLRSDGGGGEEEDEEEAAAEAAAGGGGGPRRGRGGHGPPIAGSFAMDGGGEAFAPSSQTLSPGASWRKRGTTCSH